MEGKKRMYPSAAQKTRLVALVEADEELQRGKFSSTFTKKEGDKRWANIAHELNSVPGANTEWKEWRKTWQDMKATAKRKSAACRYSAASTGGGPPAPPLSEEDKAVLRSINSNSVYGHADSTESAVHFEDLPTYRGEVVDIINEDRSKSPVLAKPAAASALVVEIYEDVPGPSTMPELSESRTGRGHMDESQHFPVTTAEKTGSTGNKDNQSKVGPIKGSKRRAAVRRLEQSLVVSDRVTQIAQETLEIKKDFYKGVLTEMRAQTKLLRAISQKLSR